MIKKELHLKILYSIYLVIITCKDVLLYFESKIFFSGYYYFIWYI